MLLGAIALSLLFWKTAFMVIVAIAVVVAIWELGRGLRAQDIDLPEQPLMVGGVVMVVVAYFYGAPALVTATAVTALVTMLWLLRRGIDGYVKNATASVFTRRLRAVPRLVRRAAAGRGRPVARAPASTTLGVAGVITFILVTIASDIGGLRRRACSSASTRWPRSSRPRSPGRGSSARSLATVGAGIVLVVYLLDG